MSDPGESPPASRRTALAAALATGGALLAGACASSRASHSSTTGSKDVPAPDVAILMRLLDLERMAIAAYTAGIPLLDHPSVPAAQQFLQQELDHEGELSGLLREAGVKPPAPNPSYNLGHPRTARQVAQLLHRIESDQVAAYMRAIPALSGGKVRAAAAAIAANDAQHVAILRARLGQPAAPAAFVTGRE